MRRDSLSHRLSQNIICPQYNRIFPFGQLRFLDPWSDPGELIAERGEDLDRSLREMLLCTESLTQRLETLFNREVTVKIEGSHLSVGEWPEECELWGCLNPPSSSSGIILRNAWLCLGSTFKLFAHSQLSMEDITLEDRQNIEKGQQALGYLFLEKNGRLEREGLCLRRAEIQNPSLFGAFNTKTTFWCRRSLFHVNGQLRARILEIFPPEK